MGTYDGTVIGSPTFGAAKFDNGLTAVSADNYIQLPNSLFQFGSAWTIEAWAKDGGLAIGLVLSSTGKSSGGNTLWMGCTSNATFTASFTASSGAKLLTSNVASNDGAWHHIAMVSTGSAVTFYVDGVLKDTETLAALVPTEGVTYYGSIGRMLHLDTPSGIYPWPGDIDEVAFWDYAKYTSNFTPETSAYVGTESGIRALFHLESDGTDGATPVTISVGTPTFEEYGPNELSFSWTAGSGGAAPYTYQVQISTDGVNFADEGTPQSGTTYFDTGLNPSTTYHYRVVATDNNNVSGTGSSASKATLATGLNYNKRDMTGEASGQSILILIPNDNATKPYIPGTDTPLLMYHSGSGEDEGALLDDALKADVVEALLDAGYILCGINAGSTNWGNQTACDRYPDLYYTVNEQYDLSYTLFLSQSMGGLTGLLTLAQNEIPSVIAWAGIYPACNLSGLYDDNKFVSAINTAYSCTADTFDAKTFGHDPCDKWGKAFRNVPMRFYASPDDTTVPKSYNTDTFQAIIETSTTESVIRVCSGVHGDASHFQPADLVAFYERALANPASTSGVGGSVKIRSIGGFIGL